MPCYSVHALALHCVLHSHPLRVRAQKIEIVVPGKSRRAKLYCLRYGHGHARTAVRHRPRPQRWLDLRHATAAAGPPSRRCHWQRIKLRRTPKPEGAPHWHSLRGSHPTEQAPWEPAAASGPGAGSLSIVPAA